MNSLGNKELSPKKVPGGEGGLQTTVGKSERRRLAMLKSNKHVPENPNSRGRNGRRTKRTKSGGQCGKRRIWESVIADRQIGLPSTVIEAYSPFETAKREAENPGGGVGVKKLNLKDLPWKGTRARFAVVSTKATSRTPTEMWESKPVEVH